MLDQSFCRELTLLYDSELSSLLDSMVPVATVTCLRRPSDPWFDQECCLKKRAVRRIERIASSCRTPESASAWMEVRRIYRSLLRNKHESFWIWKIDAEKSSPRQLWRSFDVLLGHCGVPFCDNIEAQRLLWRQGRWCSILNWWCFAAVLHNILLYCGDLQLIIESYGLCPHLYADDSQIYDSCRPLAYPELQSRILTCIDHVAECMDAFKSPPTKYGEDWDPLVATSRRLHQLPQAPLRVGTDFVTPSVAVRDLGIHLYSDISMSSHVRKTVWTCLAVLRHLRSIRRSVSRPVVQSLVHSFSVVWTTVRRHWPVFLNVFFGGFSQWWMQLLD